VWSSAILAGVGLAWLALMLIMRAVLERRAESLTRETPRRSQP
jgi:hypothetical protein